MSHPCVFPNIASQRIDPFEWAEKAPADGAWLQAEHKGPVYESVMADPAKMIAAGRAVAAGERLPAAIPQPEAISPEKMNAMAASVAAKARDQLFDRIAHRVAAELQSLGWTAEVRGADAKTPDMVAGLLPDADDDNDMSVSIGEAYATLEVTGAGLENYQVTLAYVAEASRFLGFVAPWGAMMSGTPSGFLAEAEHPSVRLLSTTDGRLSNGRTVLWDETSRGGIPADELRSKEDAIVRQIVSNLVETDTLNAKR